MACSPAMFELHLDHCLLVQYAVHFIYFVIKASSPDEGFNIVHVQVSVIATLFLTFWLSLFLSLLKHWFGFLFCVPNTIFPPVCHVTVFLKTGSYEVYF